MIYNAIYAAISACALCVFIAVLYRDYRNDVLKQNLFDVRDKLFDMAVEGRIDFNSNAYGMLRRSINGLLFGAESVSFLTLLVLGGMSWKNSKLREEEERYRQCWQEALDALDPPAQAEVQSLRNEMNFALADHVLFTSPLLQMILLPTLAWAITSVMGSVIADSLRMKFVSQTGIDNFDMVGAAMARSH